VSSPSAAISVCHLIKGLGRGGAEMLLPEGLRFADRERFVYRYAYFLPGKNALVGSLEGQGAEVTCFGARNGLQILLQARRVATYLCRLRVDVLHCHLPLAGAVGRLAGRLAGVPVVYSEHNKQERYHVLTRKLNAATWGLQSHAIAVSADVAQSVHAHVGSDVPLDIVLNGVDVNRFRRADVDSGSVRRDHRIPADAPVVGTVAVFRTQKRLGDWVEAARLLRLAHPGVHFLLVGDGPLRDEVDAEIGSAGLTDVVHRPGLQDDVRPYLAAMDVYMMSSMFEGLPVALLEAMSMCCGVVSTAVGGIPELIRSGENGLLVPPTQPAALAEAAAALLSDPARRHAYGVAARTTVESRFSMQRMTREIERIYVDVLARGRS
jgi:L-malate glycosyltransferase